MQRKFFVDETGNGEGYVVDAEKFHVNNNYVQFSNPTDDGTLEVVMIVHTDNIASVELVDDEDVEYTDDIYPDIPDGRDLPHGGGV